MGRKPADVAGCGLRRKGPVTDRAKVYQRLFFVLCVPRSNTCSTDERTLPRFRYDRLTSVADRRSGELRHLLLSELQRNAHVSQRALARRLGVALGTVNRVLSDLVESGYVQVFNRNVRPFAYRVTRDGEQFHRRLTVEVYSSALANLRRFEERIRSTLLKMRARGIGSVVFYGAGTVMETASRLASELGIPVLGAVDDDERKHGARRAGVAVHPPTVIGDLRADAVLITTLRHAEAIRQKLGRSLSSSIQLWEI